MNKVKFHTIEQPDSDTTTFVLSCNRLDVLAETMQSFKETQDYPTKMVIVDDSGVEDVFEHLKFVYGDWCDIICFPRNRSQWWAMDFMVSYCDTEYIFYLEDDWKFLKSGYLNDSKKILQKYRNVGVIDISWRTFENEGIDSYDKQLKEFKADDGTTVTYYDKKAFTITDYHLHWYGWIGSPNLKRRDDLIWLGRVEKWHNEWNIDRKFLALGYKAVFLNGQYVVHLGDYCSAIAGRRPDDSKTPYDFIPVELRHDRIYPQLNYRWLDKNYRHPHDITIVSMMIDLSRDDRTFEAHYLEGVKRLLDTRHRLILHCDEKYFDLMKKIRGNRDLTLIPFNIDNIEKCSYFEGIQNIISTHSWINQSSWMKDSVIGSRYYIAMTLMKQRMLDEASRMNNSSYFYWLDSGIYNSFHVEGPLDDYYFTRIPKDKFFITSYPYYTNSEVHGYNMGRMIERCMRNPYYVCRATLFGGTKQQIQQMTDLFYSEVDLSVKNGCVGTEEAIYTMLSVLQPDLFHRVEMPTGDIKYFLKTLKRY
ncbi:MAG: hypothetical protein M0R50_08400 [Candidatus Cloacimonetes bacterium]|jgi:hypothetical protein|nr:hypothetical protein [Candidatus Cloacimonadota bacterium]